MVGVTRAVVAVLVIVVVLLGWFVIGVPVVFMVPVSLSAVSPQVPVDAEQGRKWPAFFMLPAGALWRRGGRGGRGSTARGNCTVGPIYVKVSCWWWR